MSFKSGVKGRGSDRWWERRWWLWWGDMRRMRWTRRTVNRIRLTEWRRELIPQVRWCIMWKSGWWFVMRKIRMIDTSTPRHHCINVCPKTIWNESLPVHVWRRSVWLGAGVQGLLRSVRRLGLLFYTRSPQDVGGRVSGLHRRPDVDALCRLWPRGRESGLHHPRVRRAHHSGLYTGHRRRQLGTADSRHVRSPSVSSK